MLRKNRKSNLKTLCSITIPAIYKGPPDIANGGYVCSLFAEFIDGVIDVMIKRPTPLDRELQICADGDGMYYLMDGDSMIISAKPGVLDLPAPEAPGYEEAVSQLDSILFTRSIYIILASAFCLYLSFSRASLVIFSFL